MPESREAKAMNQAEIRWADTEAIFHAALQVSEPQRTSILTARCAGDTTLLAELRSLLAACGAEEAHRAGVSSESVEPGTSVGSYVIDALIGRGGMGAVYRAHRADGQFEQQVAIKIVDMPLVSEFFRERFRAERQMLASLSHPYIARLLDGGVTDAGELYLVMEFIDGVSITQFCTRHNLPLKERLGLFLKVSSAVGYAHRNLIVHRDLKSENILVAGDMTPRLLDFGTAKIMQPLPLGDHATQPGMQTFTPRYASPEQVLGRPISIASDIYSLGVLLFVLLTDSFPYDLADFSTEELLRVICDQPPRRPSLSGSPHGTIDADLDCIILKALRKEPAERYPTVEHLAADIHAYLEHRPVEARRGNSRYLAGKFIQRNKLALSAASLLLITLIAGLAGILWQSHRANVERQKAEARSTELRELSTSLLAEIDSAVKDLPGATPVQRLLVSRVLEHLDQLAKEGGTDPILALDMLNAYTRLGNLEGNPYAQNIGDPNGALKSLDKALSFAPALHISTTADPAALQAFGFAEQSRSEILYALGRDAESVEALKAGLVALDALAARPDATATELLAAGSAYNALGDQRNRAGNDDANDSQSSTAAYRHNMALLERTLRIDPDNLRAKRGKALMSSKIGSCLYATDPHGSVAELRRSVAAWQALEPPAGSSQSILSGQAYTFRMLGNSLTETADFNAALDAFDQALLRDEPPLASDPKNTSAVVWVAVDAEFKGLAHMQVLNPLLSSNRKEYPAHRRLAAESLRRAVDLYDSLLALAPQNPTWIAGETFSKVELGIAEYGTSEANHGARISKAALNTLRLAADKPEAHLLILVPAVEASLTVLPTSLRDPAWSLQAARQLNERTHRNNPEYLLALARAYRATGDTADAAETARQALKLLAPVPSGANRSITQTMLELEATGVDSNR